MTLPLSIDVLTLRRQSNCPASLNRQSDGYVCLGRTRTFPQERAATRFLSAEDYADSFGFQWQRWACTQLDDATSDQSDQDLSRKTCLTPEFRKGNLMLDVGFGMRCFAKVAMCWGTRVVVVDLSTAAEVAAHSLVGREFGAFQVDVFALPFAPEGFGYIHSIGVLPFVHWTRHELKDRILTVLLEPRTLDRGYLNPRGVHQLLDKHLRSRRNQSGRICQLLMFELVHRNYLVKLKAVDPIVKPESAVHASGGIA